MNGFEVKIVNALRGGKEKEFGIDIKVYGDGKDARKK